MSILFIIAVAGVVAIAGTVAVGGVIFAARSATRPRALPPPRPAERTGMNLQVRDIVTHLDRDYLVIGRVIFQEAGRTWYGYRLQDGVRLRWLRVAQHDEVEMNLVDEVDGLDFQSAPPETLTHGLVNYRLSGRGTAKASHDGSTGWEEAARVEWYEYRGPADHALFLDRWSGTCAAQAGRRIETHHIEFLPGDLVEAQANG